MEADTIRDPTLKKSIVDLKIPISITNTPSPLESILYIYHLVQFKKDQAKTQVLINSSNKVNAMTPAYIKRVGLQSRKSNIGV